MRKFCGWVFVFVWLCAPVHAEVPLYSQLVIFGDSLCDDGNLYELTGFPPSPPYFEGRFSNGPVWCEHLAASLGMEGTTTNLAVGLATTAEVRDQQLFPYLAAAGVDPDALYVFWAGANDLIDAADPEAAITDAVSNIADCLLALASGGAQHILVPNMPNLGRTPYILSLGPEIIAGAELVSLAFNAGLHDVVLSIEGEFGIDIIEPNTFTLLEVLVTQPARFGFTSTESSALTETSLAPDPDHYVFWDFIHPTRVTHELTGDDWTLQLAVHRAGQHLAALHAAGELGSFGTSFIGNQLSAAAVKVAEVRLQQAKQRISAAAVRSLVLVIIGALDFDQAVPFLQSAALANTALSTSLLD